MAGWSFAFAIVLAALAVPAGIRARRFGAAGDAPAARRESLRAVLAIAGALALLLIAKGRPA